MQVNPIDLVQHATLGAAYAGLAAGLKHPRVGLLSVGAEPGKGDRLRRATDAALRVQPPSTGRYVGPVEGAEEPDGEPHVLIEANIGEGVTSAPLSKYFPYHTRLCRPVGLSYEDRHTVCRYAIFNRLSVGRATLRKVRVHWGCPPGDGVPAGASGIALDLAHAVVAGVDVPKRAHRLIPLIRVGVR